MKILKTRPTILFFIAAFAVSFWSHAQKAANCCATSSLSSASCAAPPKLSVNAGQAQNLSTLSDVNELKKSFNAAKGKTRFIAILSSTCGWCLTGAESIQKTVIQNMVAKEMDVTIVWTDMIDGDHKEAAQLAASQFPSSVKQYYDKDNKFGDIVARSIGSKGKKAWDIYLFFGSKDEWTKRVPKPFDYAHQLSVDHHPWVDESKFFCGANLTMRLAQIVDSI